MNTGKETFGIDFGKVICGGEGEEDTSFFADNYLMTPEIEGAFEAIRILSEKYDVWLISKCGPKIQERTLEWLLSHDFYAKTQVDPAQVLFVRKRHQKAPLAQELSLVGFIDDRTDIIESMQGKIPHPVLFLNWKQTMEDLSTAKLL